MKRLHLLASIAALALVGAAPPEPTAPVLDALLANGPIVQPLVKLLADHPLAEGNDFQVIELGRDANSSHHLAWIKDREQPHRHDAHDLFVVILRGHGTMRIGSDIQPVGEGSILYVPRGTPHAFVNLSNEPAAAYAVYVPPYDGKDRVPVK